MRKRGQIVIPKKIRDMTNIQTGDSLIELFETESMVNFLKQGKPFKIDLVKHLREEW